MWRVPMWCLLPTPERADFLIPACIYLASTCWVSGMLQQLTTVMQSDAIWKLASCTRLGAAAPKCSAAWLVCMRLAHTGPDRMTAGAMCSCRNTAAHPARLRSFICDLVADPSVATHEYWKLCSSMLSGHPAASVRRMLPVVGRVCFKMLPVVGKACYNPELHFSTSGKRWRRSPRNPTRTG